MTSDRIEIQARKKGSSESADYSTCAHARLADEAKLKECLMFCFLRVCGLKRAMTCLAADAEGEMEGFQGIKEMS
jgi:hypothetical protein